MNIAENVITLNKAHACKNEDYGPHAYFKK